MNPVTFFGWILFLGGMSAGVFFLYREFHRSFQKMVPVLPTFPFVAIWVGSLVVSSVGGVLGGMSDFAFYIPIGVHIIAAIVAVMKSPHG